MAVYSRIEKLQQRRLDPLMHVAGLNEVYNSINEEQSIKYAIGAMQPIDSEYTKNTYKESERIQNQLTQPLLNLGVEVEYKHQGSVENNTHIKAHSDIDTLVIHKAFVSLEPPQQPQSPYKGDSIAELCSLREHSVKIVRSGFPEVTIDTSGAKAVSLKGGSLKRKIDLVFCNWWDTNDYVRSWQAYYRGIKVLDYQYKARIENKPFLHNEELNNKDIAVSGNCRKLIRLIKSLIYDSETKNALSSYDVAAVIYNMNNNSLFYLTGQELQLMLSCSGYLHTLITNEAARSGLFVPNKMRKIFCPEGASLSQLETTTKLLDDLILEIRQGLTRSFRKLEEARIRY